ncbi:protogenin B-like [Dysidea avara]|uniref:protogenin B-like n=1 Tax=Dysidea avara TaxID=196820 RepID=UPI003317469C
MFFKHLTCFALIWLMVVAPFLCNGVRLEAQTQNGNEYFSGGIIQFNCYYDQNNFRFLHFSHNGSGLSSGGRYSIFPSGSSYSLVISTAQRSDAGIYSCSLFSFMVEEALSLRASVMYEERVVLDIAQGQRFVGANGRPYTLDCRGEHIRKWIWGFNGGDLNSTADGRRRVLGDGTVHFSELRPVDAGIYECRVSNFVSTEFRRFRLDVIELPEVMITKQPSNIIQETNATNLTCMVTGTELISLTWSKESDGTMLTDSPSIGIIPVFANSTLIISILRFVAVTQSQQDTYRCNANNTAGSNYKLSEVSLSGLPGAPPVPLLEVINVTKVMVRLQSPNDTGRLNISHYHINYGEVHNSDSMKQFVVPATQIQIVFHLLLATEYYFSVAASNQNGQGPFSAQKTIMTHVTVPVALDVQVGNVHTDSAELSWQPLVGKNDTGGSQITNYNVTYWFSGDEQNIALTGVQADGKYLLRDLWDNRMYHVIVSACNSAGCGQPSPVVTFTTTQALPGQVQVANISVMETDGGTSVTISWRPSLIGRPILYYVIHVTQPGHPKDDFISLKTYNFSISQISTSGNIQSVPVTEVRKDQCYHFNITGVNAKGPGESLVFNWSCSNITSTVDHIQISDDGKPNTSIIIAIVVSAVVLLLIVIVVACVIIALRRCRRYKQDDDIDKRSRSDINGRRDSDISKTAVLLNYQRSDSNGTQDSIGSQLSTPRTIDSYISEQMHFPMSSNGPLDPIQENSPFDDRPRLPSPEDVAVMWTIGPAASNDIIDYDDALVPKSPYIPEPPLSNLDDQMKYTDNEAYFTFSRGQPASVKSGVKILSDNKNDGKEIVILPDNR